MSLWSKMFGESAEDRALKDAIKMVWRLVDDEKYQNEMLPPPMKELLKNTAAVDKIEGGSGEFGLDKGNPVPVNGALGELAYLSRLETLSGERMFFHRIGAINSVDVFEAVTTTGSSWHVFFLDLYHSRRSRMAPEGFRVGEPRQFAGFHTFCPKFPYDFVQCKEATPDGLRFGYIPLSSVLPALQRKVFERPLGHKAKIGIVERMMTSRSGP